MGVAEVKFLLLHLDERPLILNLADVVSAGARISDQGGWVQLRGEAEPYRVSETAGEIEKKINLLVREQGRVFA